MSLELVVSDEGRLVDAFNLKSLNSKDTEERIPGEMPASEFFHESSLHLFANFEYPDLLARESEEYELVKRGFESFLYDEVQGAFYVHEEKTDEGDVKFSLLLVQGRDIGMFQEWFPQWKRDTDIEFINEQTVIQRHREGWMPSCPRLLQWADEMVTDMHSNARPCRLSMMDD